jgi:predicted metal-binding protein
MRKIGIIRCQQTEDMCPGTTCLKVAASGKSAFEEFGQCEVVGIITCGGCPGKKSVPRAKMLVDRGAEAIAFASCIFKGTPIAFSCPNAVAIETAIKQKVGDNIVILNYTH